MESLKKHYTPKKRVLDLLTDAKKQAEDRMDVLDGPDGHPIPDAWMRMYQLIDEAIQLLR